jgi:hypothetical protein
MLVPVVGSSGWRICATILEQITAKADLVSDTVERSIKPLALNRKTPCSRVPTRAVTTGP